MYYILILGGVNGADEIRVHALSVLKLNSTLKTILKVCNWLY